MKRAFFVVSKVLTFRLKKQYSKNILDITFKYPLFAVMKSRHSCGIGPVEFS